MSDEKPMGQVIQIDEARIRDHLGEMVRGTVEETLAANELVRVESHRAPRKVGPALFLPFAYVFCGVVSFSCRF